MDFIGGLICWALIIYGIVFFIKKKKRNEVIKATTKVSLYASTEIMFLVKFIQDTVCDLNGAPVERLKEGKPYFLVFSEGNVYYQIKWIDSNENILKYDEKCIINVESVGREKMSPVENEVFADIVQDWLSKFSWMNIVKRKSNGKIELVFTKAANENIPMS